MDEENKHEHQWRWFGFWDGITLKGKRIGGSTYKCDICGEEGTEGQTVAKGGKVIEGTDISGRSLKS